MVNRRPDAFEFETVRPRLGDIGQERFVIDAASWQRNRRAYRVLSVLEVVLVDCSVDDQFAPEAGLDTVRLLEREGIAIHFPKEQTCCGQPAYTSGYPDQARAVARHQLDLFPENWPVVVPSG